MSDDHAGLVAAIGEVIPEAAWQRCYVHFLRNALDHLPRKHGDDCLQELRWLYDRRDLAEAKADLAAWLAKWSEHYPRLTTWVEQAIEQTLTVGLRFDLDGAVFAVPTGVSFRVAILHHKWRGPFSFARCDRFHGAARSDGGGRIV